MLAVPSKHKNTFLYPSRARKESVLIAKLTLASRSTSAKALIFFTSLTDRFVLNHYLGTLVTVQFQLAFASSTAF